jgi:hypothetical protein
MGSIESHTLSEVFGEENESAKNVDYYFNKNKRFTVIPLSFYPNYRKGYIFGHYYDPNG